MKKAILKIENILKIIALVVIVMLVSDIAHERTRNMLPDIKRILEFVLYTLFGVCILEGLVSLLEGILAKKEQKLWINIKNTAYRNISNLVDKRRPISVPIMYYLLIIYRHDIDICKKILELLVETYDSNDKDKSIIAYILLESGSNSAIVELFHKRPDLKQQCEKISRENVELIQGYDIEKDGVNEKFIIGLLNGCLPNNPYREKEIYLLRCMSSWMLRKLSNTVNDNEKNGIMVIIGLIPLIQYKLYNLGINDENLLQNLDALEHSKWLKKILFEAYRSIRKDLNDEICDLVKINGNMKNLGLMCTYHEKLFFYQRGCIYIKIKNRKKNAKTYLDSDEQMLSLVLFASPMKESDSEEDTIYKLASIVCACAGEFMK